MSKDEPKSVIGWEKLRETGILKFVLEYGVLFFGMPMFEFTCLMNHFFSLVANGTPASIWIYAEMVVANVNKAEASRGGFFQIYKTAI